MFCFLYILIFLSIVLGDQDLPEYNDQDYNITVKRFPFFIYANANNKNFFSNGLSGDIYDIEFDDYWQKNPKSKGSCIKIKYTGERDQGFSWAEIFWLSQEYNWGFLDEGCDLSSAKKLYFSARGRNGGELVEFRVGGINGQFYDSTFGNRILIELTSKWQIYEIDLTDKDLSHIIGGFGVSFSHILNIGGCTIYLDDIYFYDKHLPMEVMPLFQKYKNNKIKILIKDFKNTTATKDFDHFTRIIPEMIKSFLDKRKKVQLVKVSDVNKALNNVSANAKRVNNKNLEIILEDILQVHYIIDGYIEQVQDKIRIHLLVYDKKTNKQIIKKYIEKSSEKELYIWIDQVLNYMYKKITK